METLDFLNEHFERQAPATPKLPSTSAEKANMIAHYYRGELGRMASWRDRIDRTSNWAITLVAGVLSVSLSTPNSHHGIVLFAMLLISLFLLIEARRYRFFDVYRSRVRQLERNYFSQALLPHGELDDDWSVAIASSLRSPIFLMGRWEAISRRIRRNYVWMYLILLAAWFLKISTPKLLPNQPAVDTVWSFGELVKNAALGPLPGWSVLTAVACIYVGIIAAAVARKPGEGEFAFGDVHV